MRSLRRNKQTVYYSTRSVTEAQDKWGNTSDVKSYATPVELNIGVSEELGKVSVDGFGKPLDYDREMTTHDLDCPIDEYTHLWIDRPVTESYDYEVKGKSKSKNAIVYRIKRVDAS